MRLLMIAVLAASPFIGVQSALAQYESRQEQQYREINRSIGQQQRQRQQLQQNRFELNQMQQNIQRNQLFTPPPSGPGPEFYRR